MINFVNARVEYTIPLSNGAKSIKNRLRKLEKP